MNRSEVLPIPQKGPATPARPRRLNRQELCFRLIIVGLLLGSIAMVWWSFGLQLLPLLKQSKALNSTIARLSAEVDDLERKWPKAQQEQVALKHQQAHAQLFADQAALEAWMANLKAQSLALALETRTTFGKTIPQFTRDDQVVVIPTTISVEARPLPANEAKGSPYQRVLKFGQELTGPGKRADLTDLTVIGGAGSVASTMLAFNLWAGQKGTP